MLLFKLIIDYLFIRTLNYNQRFQQGSRESCIIFRSPVNIQMYKLVFLYTYAD